MRGLWGLIRTHWQHTLREEPGGEGGGGGVVGAKGLLGLVSQPEALVWVLGSRAETSATFWVLELRAAPARMRSQEVGYRGNDD